ncbi:MAG: APC family permease [Gammaproteobacteria bacterium]|nr:APC family permease [Gammaproteobacteria bacterium]
MPKFFDRVHALYRLSRPSLVLTLAISIVVILFFKNWQKVAALTSVFYVLSCLSVPICFAKLRKSEPNKERPFKMPFGRIISLGLFLLLSYLLIQADGKMVLTALILHTILFLIYTFSFYRGDYRKMAKALLSAWSIFAYLVFSTLFSYLRAAGELERSWLLVLFFLLSLILYFCLIHQRCYMNCQDSISDK